MCEPSDVSISEGATAAKTANGTQLARTEHGRLLLKHKVAHLAKAFIFVFSPNYTALSHCHIIRCVIISSTYPGQWVGPSVSKLYFSQVFFFKVFPAHTSSKLCESISPQVAWWPQDICPSPPSPQRPSHPRLSPGSTLRPPSPRDPFRLQASFLCTFFVYATFSFMYGPFSWCKPWNTLEIAKVATPAQVPEWLELTGNFR